MRLWYRPDRLNMSNDFQKKKKELIVGEGLSHEGWGTVDIYRVPWFGEG